MSREAHILHLVILMISSTFQRLLRKTCGLFDSGFAGDVDFITSPGLNAPVAAVNEYDPLSDLGPDGPSLYPSTSGMKAPTMTEKQVVNKAENSDWFDDLDPDLSGDPLGDDSMEAFINLDKFLNGNSFFDEDGNLTVPEEKSVNQLIDGEAEVAPVINFVPETAEDPSIDFLMGSDAQDFLLVNEDKEVMGGMKPSRKRPAGSRMGVKTSLYEIPAMSVMPEPIQDGSTALSDTELDHDYSTKRQRLSVLEGNDSTPSTSGTMSKFTEGNIPQTHVTNASSNPVQIIDESLDKQTIRRIKNNHASKRSREQRKQKFVDMDLEAEELVVRNQQLREKIVELEKLAIDMKAMLVAKMAGRAV